MEIKIRDALPADSEAADQVRYQSWLVTYPNTELNITVEDIKERLKEQLSPEGIKKRQARIIEFQEKGRYVVAEVEGRIVGFCWLIRYPEKNQLRGMYVLPGYQGKGVGKALWQEAKQAIDPEKETYVEVATYNESAIGFYSKLGFKDTGRRFTEEGLTMKNGATIPEMEMKLETK